MSTTTTDPRPPASYPFTDWEADPAADFFVPDELRADYAAAAAAGVASPDTFMRLQPRKPTEMVQTESGGGVIRSNVPQDYSSWAFGQLLADASKRRAAELEPPRVQRHCPGCGAPVGSGLVVANLRRGLAVEVCSDICAQLLSFAYWSQLPSHDGRTRGEMAADSAAALRRG